MYKMLSRHCQNYVQGRDNPVNMTNIGLMLVHCPQCWPTLNEHCFKVSVSVYFSVVLASLHKALLLEKKMPSSVDVTASDYLAFVGTMKRKHILFVLMLFGKPTPQIRLKILQQYR